MSKKKEKVNNQADAQASGAETAVPKKKRIKLVGYYDYTVILTYIGFLAALVGIIFAIKGKNQIALCCLMGCGLTDMFDGTIARTKKNRTEEEVAFGAHIDSLNDIVAFGILPAVILYGFGFTSVWSYVAMGFYALTAIIRLAYFDVQEMLIIKDNPNARREYFTGLPVTNSAIIMPGIMTINIFIGIEPWVLYLVLLVLVGAAFITPFKMKKLYMPWLVIPAIAGFALAALLIIKGGVYNY